jgi:hypothetical protein
MVVHEVAMFLCKERAGSIDCAERHFDAMIGCKAELSRSLLEGCAMRLIIELIAAVLLVTCVGVSSAAFAAGKTGRTADGLTCSFSVAKGATPASRCAAIKRQCGGKFYANYCGDKLVSAVK